MPKPKTTNASASDNGGNPFDLLIESRVARAVEALTDTVLARTIVGDSALLTRNEAAAALGLASKTLEAMAADGSGPRITRIKGAVRYSVWDIKEFIKESRASSVAGRRRRAAAEAPQPAA